MPTSPLKADDLFAAWSRKQFKAIYLFTGQEDFLIEEAVHKLSAERLPAGTEDTNLDRLNAEDVSANEIIQACQTMPFASPFRVIEVSNTHRLSSDEQKVLAAALPQLPTTTQLILIWGKEWRRDDATKPLVEAVLSVGSVVIFWPLFPENAQRWIMQRAKEYKKTLAPEAASWLVQETGEGLRRLDQELAKVCAYVGGRPEIEREDVEACFGYQKTLSPYEWLTALRQKKYPQSMRTLRQLLEDDEEPLKLLAMATGSLRDWIETKERGGNQPMGKPNPYRKDAALVAQDLEKRPVEDLVEGLSCCVEAHQSIKTGKETPAMALTLLTLRLCGLQSLDSVR